MIGSDRKGIWFAILLLISGQGCRSADVRPQSDMACRAPSLSAESVAVEPSAAAATSPPATPIIPASHQAEVIASPPPSPPADAPAPEPLPPPVAAAAAPHGSDALQLDDVVQSVLAGFPLLRAELAERDVADGRNLSAWGPYDLNLEMYSIAEPMGFYRNYRSGVSLKQAVYRGGYLYGGYRVGRGDIEPWFKDRLTNEAGEFKLGAGVPLLQGRRIDKYRAEVMAADVARAAVEPGIQAELLQFVLAAGDAYWSWVAAGKMVDAQRQLLQLATTRVQQIEERVDAGDLERIAVIDNQRLIASRETKLIESERKLQAAAIKLSLFLRDENGQPRVADSDRLPPEFPPLQPYDVEQLPGDIEQAYTTRPELRYLDLQIQEIEIELAAAENMLQPRIDARIEASKDIGAPGSSVIQELAIKTPFELEAGIWGELPLQRRQACGKIQSLRGKLSQLAAKRQYSGDKVATEVRDAVSALEAAAGRIQRARTTADLARQSLDLGRQGFESGDLTVVTLNLYEQAVLDADLQLIEAQADYFKARAAYRAAMGADAMEGD